MTRFLVRVFRWSSTRPRWARVLLLVPLSIAWCFVPDRVWDRAVKDAFPHWWEAEA